MWFTILVVLAALSVAVWLLVTTERDMLRQHPEEFNLPSNFRAKHVKRYSPLDAPAFSSEETHKPLGKRAKVRA